MTGLDVVVVLKYVGLLRDHGGDPDTTGGYNYISASLVQMVEKFPMVTVSYCICMLVMLAMCTWARVFCLIRTPEFLRAADLRVEGVHIRQNTSAHVATVMYHSNSVWVNISSNPRQSFHLAIYRDLDLLDLIRFSLQSTDPCIKEMQKLLTTDKSGNL